MPRTETETIRNRRDGRVTVREVELSAEQIQQDDDLLAIRAFWGEYRGAKSDLSKLWAAVAAVLRRTGTPK